MAGLSTPGSLHRAAKRRTSLFAVLDTLTPSPVPLSPVACLPSLVPRPLLCPSSSVFPVLHHCIPLTIL